MGLLYLIFCWTFIPALVAVLEGLNFLMMSQEVFDHRYNPGLARAVPTLASPQNIVVNVANSAMAGSGGEIAAQLKSLHELKQSGALTDEEFVAEKRRLLTGTR